MCAWSPLLGETMGLDMYLTKKTYVKNWSFTPEDEQFSVSVNRGGEKYEQIDTSRITVIEEEVIYWRKANAIHKYFVDIVQNGEDDCGTHRVNRVWIKDLVERCERVLALGVVQGPCHRGTVYQGGAVTKQVEEGSVCADPTEASYILPTTDGFFFGSTDYDEGYLDDLRRTVCILKPLLDVKDESVSEFYYHSSW